MHVCMYVCSPWEFKLFLYVVCVRACMYVCSPLSLNSFCVCVYVCVLTFEFKLFLYVTQVGIQVFYADVYYGRNSFDHVRNIIGREPLVQQVL